MKTPKSKKKLITSIFVISLILIPIITVQVKTKDELIYLPINLAYSVFGQSRCEEHEYYVDEKVIYDDNVLGGKITNLLVCIT